MSEWTIDEQIQFEETHLALHRGLREDGIYVWPDVEAQDSAIVAILASLRRIAVLEKANAELKEKLATMVQEYGYRSP